MSKYSVTVDGKEPQRVTAASPIEAADRFRAQHGIKEGIIVVRDKWGRTRLYHTKRPGGREQ